MTTALVTTLIDCRVGSDTTVCPAPASLAFDGPAAKLAPPRLIEGINLDDQGLNTPEDIILDQVRQSIRRGHPQVWPTGLKADRIALVGGGPSLESTLPELVSLVRQGAKLVTTNGAYRWCVDRNLQPSAQIVLDARPGSVRFVEPEIPKCRYYLASQCHPAVWDAVAGREYVGIWHSIVPEAQNPQSEKGKILTEYYGGHWHGVAGGTTVITRAIGLLRMMGYLRFDLFGVDSCAMGKEHHAYTQPENDKDALARVTVAATGSDTGRDFWCSAWHIKQAEDFAQIIRLIGDKFLLNVHGDGLIAYMMQSAADVQIQQTK